MMRWSVVNGLELLAEIRVFQRNRRRVWPRRRLGVNLGSLSHAEPVMQVRIPLVLRGLRRLTRRAVKPNLEISTSFPCLSGNAARA
jgi:hypothetical protein